MLLFDVRFYCPCRVFHVVNDHHVNDPKRNAAGAGAVPAVGLRRAREKVGARTIVKTMAKTMIAKTTRKKTTRKRKMAKTMAKMRTRRTKM